MTIDFPTEDTGTEMSLKLPGEQRHVLRKNNKNTVLAQTVDMEEAQAMFPPYLH